MIVEYNINRISSGDLQENSGWLVFIIVLLIQEYIMFVLYLINCKYDVLVKIFF